MRWSTSESIWLNTAMFLEGKESNSEISDIPGEICRHINIGPKKKVNKWK